MRRRAFIALIGSAAAWPHAARAQLTPVIGFLSSASPDTFAPFVAGFHQGLRETGYNEGQNLAVEYRWAFGHYDRLPALAADLVGHRVAVLVTTGGAPSALAGKGATKSIPVLFITGSDPVILGLVTSLNRPGGNITGVNWFSYEVTAKRLGLLQELLPHANPIGMLVNAKGPESKRSLRMRRRPHIHWVASSFFSMPVPRARSTQPSRRWCASGAMRWL